VAVCEPVFTCDRSWAPFPAAGDRQRQQNDPNDARSVATAALRSTGPRLVDAEGPAALRLLSKRGRDLGILRTQSHH
jgi:hypothetical protein